MLSIARLFLPASTSWDSLNEVVQSKYGKDDNFSKLVAEATPSVSSLMEELIVALPVYFEMINVHLSSKFAQPVGGMPVFLDLLPADFKQAHFVRAS
jgi:hypothetical protein